MMLGPLRYLLVIFPALGTVYLLDLDWSGRLTFHTLLLLALVELRRGRLPVRWGPAAALLEMIFVAWLSYQYGSLMLLCHLSTLGSYMSLSFGNVRWLLLAVHLVLLQAPFLTEPQPELAWGSTILMLAAAVMLHALIEAERQRKEQELIHDELRSKTYELDASKSRVVEYAGKVEQLAQAEERQRISREIHDDLGHRLIRLKLMLEAAVRLAPSEPEKGLALTKQVLDQLGEGMEKLRLTVRKLQPGDQEVQCYSLAKLIEGLAAEAQVAISYEVTGNPMMLYPSLEIVLYRNAQEAITNALRHGQATAIDLKLSYEPFSVRLVVTNNGRIPEAGTIHKGLGIRGMEERTKLLGGELILELDPAFEITTVLPIRS